jgi:non-reducing end alpha-L-arabinofuranosidase
MNFSGFINRFNAMAFVIISLGLAQTQIFGAEGPCDIYKTAGTPCVAAYSTVRALSSTYTGPLYQVRRTSDKVTKDITQTTDGYADAAVQETFLGSNAGTISKLYDQSGKANDLTVAKKGSYTGTASQDDKESDAKGLKISINGHSVYAIYAKSTEGYRAKQEGYTGYPAKITACAGMPTGNQPQGIYMLTDGSRPNIGCCCCFDFGNASLDNAAGGTGMMNTLFFGTGYWGKGQPSGPWFENDMEAGVWAGGSGASGTTNNNLPSSKFNYAFGITKTSTTTLPQYAIRVATATVGPNSSPKLVTAYDGQAPSTWKEQGGIVLGIGGDNSNSSDWTFYEGCITAGRPSDKTDTLILNNIVAARYGSTTTLVQNTAKSRAVQTSYTVHYNPTSAKATFNYTMRDTRRVSMSIFDQQGRQISLIVNGIVSAGQHEAVWDANRVPAGVYVCRAAIDGQKGWSGKIIIGK